MTRLQELTLSWRFALREMRSGLKGFYIFLACIALGVAAIGGVNGVSRNISSEIARQGQTILAGDIRFSLTQREANQKEMAYFQSKGHVAKTVLLRSMARRVDTGDQTLVEIKAVDDAYPLYGVLKTVPQLSPKELFQKTGDAFGAVAPKLLLDRLQIHVGDRIKVGQVELIIRAMLDDESDLLSESFQLGPRLFMSIEALQDSGLLQPGSLRTFVYKVAIPTITDDELKLLKQTSEKVLSDSGWSIHTRMEAAPVLTKDIERFSSFLTLIGLTALIVGGVGIANAVRAYMEKKRSVIATFKSLGASGRMIMEIYFSQLMLITLLGIAIGLVFALSIPFAVNGFLRHYMPFFGVTHIYPTSLALAVAFALLTTAAFAILPLAKARYVPVTSLLRPFDRTYDNRREKSTLFIAILLFILTGLLAFFTSYDRRLSVIFLLIMVGVFIVLRSLAFIIQYCAKKCAHIRSAALRLAISNIYRPGALTPSIVVALGLGLTLLVTLATIDGNLRKQLAQSVPEKAPDFFFMDIARNDAETFATFIKEQDQDGRLKIMPTLRARVIKLNGIAAKDAKINPDSAWVLRGDRNITYSDTMPENTKIAEGKWWSNNPSGETEVSFSQTEGRELGLKLGDTVVVNVLGHEITAKISSFRSVEWDSFNMNFVMIFSPQAFKNAPHVWLATFKSGNENTIDEAAFMREISKRFPSITVVPVRQVLSDASKIIDEIALAVRASSSIALIASVLVLAGALSATNRSRARDAVILKMLGATRKMLVRAYVYEYAILGFAVAVFAFLAGGSAGWAIAYYKMKLTNATLTISSGLTVIIIAFILSIGFGLIGTWRILGEKPSRFLKDL